MPCGPRKRSSSSMRVRIRRNFVFVDQGQNVPTIDTGTERIGDVAQQVGVAPQIMRNRGLQIREPVDDLRLHDGGCAQRQQADDRANLQPRAGAVGQPQDVVEETVLLVPHLVGPISHRVDGGRNPEEALQEIEDEVLVRRVALRQDE